MDRELRGPRSSLTARAPGKGNRRLENTSQRAYPVKHRAKGGKGLRGEGDAAEAIG